MLARVRELVSRLRTVFTMRKLDDDFAQELDSHLDLLTNENIRKGMSPEEARRAARLKLGSEPALRETHHDQRTIRWLESLAQDMRFALRMLRKNPGFTVVAILTLALGIGANTAIFSIVNVALLRPLPYVNPSNLVRVWNTYLPAWPQLGLSPGDFQDFQQRSRDFSEMAAYVSLPTSSGFNLTGQGDPQRVTTAYATSNFFSMLGLRPIVGRFFAPTEDKPNAAPVVVLSHDLWQSAFHSDPAVIGHVINLDGQGYAVLGVAPDEIRLVAQADLWMPVGQYNDDLTGHIHHPFNTMARLKSGITIAQAQAELDILNKQETLALPATHQNWGVRLDHMESSAAATFRLELLALLGTVALVLLIACANIVNLLLARNTARRKEIGVRIALGAGRARLTRQLLTESILLSLAGGSLGLFVANVALRALRLAAPPGLAELNNVSLDATVLAFTFIICFVTGIICGAIPALHTLRSDLYGGLKESGRTTTGFESHKLRGGLVVAEIALALMPLICAGLLVRSLRHLLDVSPGFRPDHALTMKVTIPGIPAAVSNKMTPAEQQALARKQSLKFENMAAAIQHLPGVESVGGVDVLPLGSAMVSASRFLVEGRPVLQVGARPVAQTRIASSGYFAAMGIPLIRGRLLNEQDFSTQNIVINQAMASRFWSGDDATGKRINLCSLAPQPCWFTVVGVIGDVHQFGLDKTPTFDVYSSGGWTPYFIIRTASDPSAIALAAPEEIHKIDPSLPVTDVSTLDLRLSDSVSAQRFSTVLLGIFAALALLLAAVGVYGVMSYVVSTRTGEIGIRMALGAQPKDVWGLVIGRAARLALFGVTLGLIGTLITGRYLATLLFDVRPADPLTLFGAAALLFVVALAACYIPARRAMRVDPVSAMRCE
jgi:predicted permease